MFLISTNFLSYFALKKSVPGDQVFFKFFLMIKIFSGHKSDLPLIFSPLIIDKQRILAHTLTYGHLKT